jgi:hypothetical protein
LPVVEKELGKVKGTCFVVAVVRSLIRALGHKKKFSRGYHELWKPVINDFGVPANALIESQLY